MASYSPYNAMTGASVGSNGTIGGAVSGVASGAQAGSSFGVVGAVIGGALGGIVGGITGSKSDKSAYYQRLASQVQQQRAYNQAYAQQLQYVRQVRSARATSLVQSAASGISDSSLGQGALDSIGSQSAYSLQTLGEDMRLNELYNTYMSKANKALDSANTISQYANLLMSGLNAYSNVMAKGTSQLEQQQEQALKEIASQWDKAYSAAIAYNSKNISAAESYYKGLRSGSSSSSRSAWSMTKGDVNRRVDISSALSGLYNLKKQNNLFELQGKLYR